MSDWASWATAAFLIIIRGLMGATDAALYAVSDARAKELSKEFPVVGGRLLKLKTEREATAGSIRLAQILSGFTAAALSTLIFATFIQNTLSQLTQARWILGWGVPIISVLIMAGIATAVELILRTMALKQPENWALALSGFGTAASIVMFPVMWLVVTPLNVLFAPFRMKPTFALPPPPLAELEKLLQQEAQKEEVDKGAPALIRSIFEMTDKTCRDLMVPRTEMVCIDVSTPIDEVLRIVGEEGHSRLPVFKDDVDHIVGILHVRDLVPLIQHPELIVLSDVVRPAVYIPWVKPIGDLLREMQKQRIHMAVVVDEYGGVMGAVTLEDILREIVGDIADEFEVDEKQYEKLADGSYVVDAGLSIEEFRKSFDMEMPEGDYDTVGGLLSTIAGAIPEVNDKFTIGQSTLVVQSKDGPKVTRVKLTRPKRPKESVRTHDAEGVISTAPQASSPTPNIESSEKLLN